MTIKTLLLISILFIQGCYAGLPASVSGQPIPSLAPMLEQVTPAVVNIATEGHVQVGSNALLNDPFFRNFFNLPKQLRRKKVESLGSGVVVDARRGYIITNSHVIAKADKITVTLRDGLQMDAQLVGSDKETDIAVIHVNKKNLKDVKLADSDRLRVGDFVVAIGNPFGLGQTVTSGIVSALGRSGLGIEGYEDFIQTDASINVGNSGGALVNLRGELVGINTAILAPGGGSVGIGFAIPSNMVKRVMENLVNYGTVKRGRLGIKVQDISPALAEAFKLESTHGVIITSVVKDSPAHRAGLETGDVLIGINRKKIKNSFDIRNAFGLHIVGDTIALTAFRNGQSITFNVLIDKTKENKLSGSRFHSVLSGSVLGLIDVKHPLFRRIEGVEILDVKAYSDAFKAGLRKGDIITGVNGHLVTSLEEFETYTMKYKKSPKFSLNIRRKNNNLLLMLQ